MTLLTTAVNRSVSSAVRVAQHRGHGQRDKDPERTTRIIEMIRRARCGLRSFTSTAASGSGAGRTGVIAGHGRTSPTQGAAGRTRSSPATGATAVQCWGSAADRRRRSRCSDAEQLRLGGGELLVASGDPAMCSSPSRWISAIGSGAGAAGGAGGGAAAAVCAATSWATAACMAASCCCCSAAWARRPAAACWRVLRHAADDGGGRAGHDGRTGDRADDGRTADPADTSAHHGGGPFFGWSGLQSVRVPRAAFTVSASRRS